MKKKMIIQDVIDLGYVRTNENKKHGYCHIFVYTPNGSHLVKGIVKDAREYVEKHFPICFYHLVWFDQGKTRDHYSSPIKGFYIFSRTEGDDSQYYCRKRGRRYYEVTIYDKFDKTKSVKMKLRRMPKKWIPFFNHAIAKTSLMIPS